MWALIFKVPISCFFCLILLVLHSSPPGTFLLSSCIQKMPLIGLNSALFEGAGICSGVPNRIADVLKCTQTIPQCTAITRVEPMYTQCLENTHNAL